MNKNDFITIVAEKAILTKKDTTRFLDAFTESVIELLQNGERVPLVGFGTFEPRLREAREGRNPQTGETIQIPAKVVPAFKAGKAFKDALK